MTEVGYDVEAEIQAKANFVDTMFPTVNTPGKNPGSFVESFDRKTAVAIFEEAEKEMLTTPRSDALPRLSQTLNTYLNTAEGRNFKRIEENLPAGFNSADLKKGAYSGVPQDTQEAIEDFTKLGRDQRELVKAVRFWRGNIELATQRIRNGE